VPGDRIMLATVPDEATAQLLAEVLRDGGIESVEIATTSGNAYLGRAHALDYEVRVLDVDEANARKVLADFEETSEQAAVSQAAIPPDGEAADSSPLRKRKPWVQWGFIALALAMFGIPLLEMLRRFLDNLVGR
jgi:hypothetical protein